MCNLVISSDGLWSSSACDKKQTTLCFRGSVSRYPCPPTGTYCFIVYSIFIVVNVDTNRHVAGMHLISAPTLTPLLWPNKYTVWIRPPNSSQPLHQKLQSTDTFIIVDITTADALTWLFKLNTVHSFSEKMRFSSFGSALFASKLLEGGTTDRLIPVRRPHGLINGSALGLGSVSVWEAEGCLFSRCWCLSSNCTYAELKFFSTKFSTAPLRSQVSPLHSSVSAGLCLMHICHHVRYWCRVVVVDRSACRYRTARSAARTGHGEFEVLVSP